MSRKVVFLLDAGFAGTDEYQFIEYTDPDVTDEQISDDAWQAALDHAEMYGIYPRDTMPDDYDEDEDAGGWGSDQYSDNIGGYFEDYDPEKHDGYSHSGTPTFTKY